MAPSSSRRRRTVLLCTATASLLAAALIITPVAAAAASPASSLSDRTSTSDIECSYPPADMPMGGPNGQRCAYVDSRCSHLVEGLINWPRLHYCLLPSAYAPLSIVVQSLALVVLFAFLGTAASEFFCPNLNSIASSLHMSESLAGVTLLAFGNGSPDLISTFTAMRSHSGGLAIGELIGASAFITTLVLGGVALVAPFRLPAPLLLYRDAIFFLGALGFLGYVTWDGSITLGESLALIGYYGVYVATVVTMDWVQIRKLRRHGSAATLSGAAGEDADGAEDVQPLLVHTDDQGWGDPDHLSVLEEDNLSDLSGVSARSVLMRRMRAKLSLLDAVEFVEIWEHANAEMEAEREYQQYQQQQLAVAAGTDATGPSGDSIPFPHLRRHASDADMLDSPLLVSAFPSVSRTNSAHTTELLSPFPTAARMLAPVMPGSPSKRSLPRRKESASSAALLGVPGGHPATPRQSSLASLSTPDPSCAQVQPQPQPQPPLPAVLSSTDSPAPLSIDTRPVSAPNLTSFPSSSTAAPVPPHSLHSPTFRTSPRSITSHDGAGVISMAVPMTHRTPLALLFPVVVSHAPSHYHRPTTPASTTAIVKTHSSWIKRAAMWLLTPLYFVLRITVPVVSREGPTTFGAEVRNPVLCPIQHFFGGLFCALVLLDGFEYPHALAPPAILIGLSISLLGVLMERWRPGFRYHIVWSWFGFLVGMLWIYVTANEVVTILKTLGVVLKISDGVLGLTVFAMGNSVGDFIANVTMARLGFPTMAVSACFASPMLNLVLGVGVSCAYMTLVASPDKPLDLTVGSSVKVVNLGLIAVLTVALALLAKSKFYVGKWMGVALLASYSALVTVALVLGS
ncbi:Sodium/calcium exchanger protein-domain-containing protein [Catenaria anguillulae PL171]|uniref:Sodium/calcium exchanger protein-domain-containing protein n=1 Tax=Catenaria anguillulae PL171 TaxID=765915 RepID=A0A1Y2I2D9_9FUNG|nr:Sodium/calcium exchanger protein-domain-containing protein [Catenaria anguillulae PL171]